MKTNFYVCFVFGCLLISAAAFAQNQPAPVPDKNKSQPQNGEQDKKNASQALAMQAAQVVTNAQHQVPNNYIAIPVNQEIWAPLLKDKDAGPFLKLKEQKPGLSAVILMANPEESSTYCVYFDDVAPIGMVTLPPAAGGKIDADAVAKAYKPVSKDMLKESSDVLVLSDTEVNSDDGQPLVAFSIQSNGKKKKN